jgi:transcription initiation factor TFIID TATA-box-binding protein
MSITGIPDPKATEIFSEVATLSVWIPKPSKDQILQGRYYRNEHTELVVSSSLMLRRRSWDRQMVDKKYETLKIENIVASGVVADSIDLVEFSNNVGNCELNKKRFPGAVYRIPDPKIACLIFSSGKIVMTGIRNKKALADGLAIVIESLKKVGVTPLKEPRVAITNMVCSYNLGKYININKLSVTLNLENIEYEPEQFPGLVYRIKDPKIVVLIFSSGKIILTGGRNLEDVKKGLDLLEAKLATVL